MATCQKTPKIQTDDAVAVRPGYVGPTRRCDTNQVAPNGDCVACGAINGEACQLPKSEAA